MSCDPTMKKYLPEIPIDDEAKERNQNLPGEGGVFNPVNLALYHYAGNNPVKFYDPTGSASEYRFRVTIFTSNTSNITSITEYRSTDINIATSAYKLLFSSFSKKYGFPSSPDKSGGPLYFFHKDDMSGEVEYIDIGQVCGSDFKSSLEGKYLIEVNIDTETGEETITNIYQFDSEENSFIQLPQEEWPKFERTEIPRYDEALE